MKHRSHLLKTTAASAALLTLLAACGEDRSDTSVSDGAGDGTLQAPSTIKKPATIKIARAGSANATAAGAAESMAADQAPTDGKMIAPEMWMRHVTYVAGAGLTDVTGARTSWFFPADGYVVSDEQKAALAAAFGLTGEWADLPADWGGGQSLGPNDGSAPAITISADAMASWWYNPGPIAGTAVEPCVTSVDASTGEERTECPTPTPPANVPDQATAEAKARELFAAMGLDASQYEYEAYADEWGAWVTAWLLLDGQRAPVTLYAGFGAEGALTGAGGFLARPIQGDQYDLVGIDHAIERLNDQQYGWIGMGGAMAKSAEVDVAAGEGVAGSSGTAGGDSTTPPDATTETTGPVATTVAPEVEEVTVTLTSVRTDLTMVWDADNTVWLLPAYSFTADDGGQYQIIAIDDEFIELPEAVPMPEPLPAEQIVDPAVPVEVDQTAADTLVGLSEDEATKLAESNGWTVRVGARDGEQFPVTMDYRTDRVTLTIEAGVVTAVMLG